MGALDRLGHHVEVLGRVQRNGDPDLVAEGLGPLSRAVDDHLGLDGALVGHHAGDPAAGHTLAHGEAGDPDPLGDPGAGRPSTPREGLGQVGRVDLPVAGQPDRAEQVVDPHRRPQLLGALGAHQLAGQVVGRGVRRGPAQLHHPVGGARDDQPADVAVPGRQSRLGLQGGVELGRVLHEPGAALRGAQRAHQPGGVPGGAARERALLEQQHVGPAEPGEVVGHGRADDPAADDHRPGAGREVNHRRPPPRGARRGQDRGTSRPPSRSAPSPRRGSRSRSGSRPPG